CARDVYGGGLDYW
nr:immunoglobulin heavy chain junction region [Macaca mulatta]MOW77549.1 immunoglobulin heavy chain junction region [Macaca mulatta]MOW77563.1 immunoglobulin heavy chain junction region [Macaca mulatta]MOW77889.1 immunoglobulin heavy chain junction region [Macaca mulatta]MOW79381.1 immunoglobulin heavy chain junction region [Macaca mulatta]